MGAHNNRVEGVNQNKPKDRMCSCPKTKNKQPFKCKYNNKCLEDGIVYIATGDDFNYIGLTKGNLNNRVNKHEHSFMNPLKEHETRLSTKM